jgi:hypothetical protein
MCFSIFRFNLNGLLKKTNRFYWVYGLHQQTALVVMGFGKIREVFYGRKGLPPSSSGDKVRD